MTECLKMEINGHRCVWFIFGMQDKIRKMMKLIDIDWVKHETTTGSSKSVSVNPAYPLGTGNPAYPLGGGGNYQCSNTVDTAPVKHGHWDFLPMRNWNGVPEYYANCSECRYHEKAYTCQFVIDNWHYCPHCGAKMDGERKE